MTAALQSFQRQHQRQELIWNSVAFVLRLNKPKIKPPETAATMTFPHLVVIRLWNMNCVLNRSFVVYETESTVYIELCYTYLNR